jgi:hypothetical protein
MLENYKKFVKNFNSITRLFTNISILLVRFQRFLKKAELNLNYKRYVCFKL